MFAQNHFALNIDEWLIQWLFSLLFYATQIPATSTISSRIPPTTAHVEQKIETISIEWYRRYDWDDNIIVDDEKQHVHSKKIATYVYPHNGADTNTVIEPKQRYDRQ